MTVSQHPPSRAGSLPLIADDLALDFAKAAACLKHAIPGDFNLAREEDVKAFLADDGLDVRR